MIYEYYCGVRSQVSLILALGLFLTGCGASTERQAAVEPGASSQRRIPVATPEEALNRGNPAVPKGETSASLVVTDLIEGTGPAAEAGRILLVRYVAGIYETGEEIESAGEPQAVGFMLGSGDWSLGWESGMRGMRVGGRRLLVFPTTPAHTPRGSNLGDTLVYVVDLVGISAPQG